MPGKGLPKKSAMGQGQQRMKRPAPMLCWQSQLLELWVEKSGHGDLDVRHSVTKQKDLKHL